MKHLLLIASLLLLGAGCTSPSLEVPVIPVENSPSVVTEEPVKEISVVYPLDFSVVPYDTSFKPFGKLVSDRFSGYHAGTDFEIPADAPDISVRAIADGTVKYVGYISGYGGVVIIRHTIEDESVTALYGHVRLASVSIAAGDEVTHGQNFAVLGADKSKETDGERRHLHFALYSDDVVKFAGYVSTEKGLEEYRDPERFFEAHGL